MKDSEDTEPRLPVALLGATGTVGQRFVQLLAQHPWFELVALHASARSAGRPYGEVVRWVLDSPLPESIAGLELLPPPATLDQPIAFSALDASVAGPIEQACARSGALVFSNAKNHRLDPDVPLIVPEINPEHLDLLEDQDYGGGGIVTNPNCSTIGLVLALAPLDVAFGLSFVHVVSLQALSGAGFVDGAPLELHDNLIPFIAGEEEKLEAETQKILGELIEGAIAPAALPLSAACNRVAVRDGHTLCISIALDEEVEREELIEAWSSFEGPPQELELPSAPARPLHYLDAEDAPQPALHRDLEGGMAASIARLRPCPLFDWKFVTLSHNTLRGAAGGALLNAELALATGRVGRG